MGFLHDPNDSAAAADSRTLESANSEILAVVREKSRTMRKRRPYVRYSSEQRLAMARYASRWFEKHVLQYALSQESFVHSNREFVTLVQRSNQGRQRSERIDCTLSLPSRMKAPHWGSVGQCCCETPSSNSHRQWCNLPHDSKGHAMRLIRARKPPLLPERDGASCTLDGRMV